MASGSPAGKLMRMGHSAAAAPRTAQAPSGRRLHGRERRSPGQQLPGALVTTETLGLAFDRRPGVHGRHVPFCAMALPVAWSAGLQD